MSEKVDLFSVDLVEKPDSAYLDTRNCTNSIASAVKELCNDLYDQFHCHADSGFVDKFQYDFYERFWEMDLTCVMENVGFSVSSADKGPDICLQLHDDNKVWIEAVCPKEGSMENKIPEAVDGYAYQIPTDKITLRLANSICKKHEQHLTHVKNGYCSGSEPFVVAINGCRLVPGPGLDDITPRIVKTVFSIGKDTIYFDRDSGEVTDTGYEERNHVKKNNGKPVSLNFFMTEEYGDVSAILYSESNCRVRPTENGGDYVLVHNPYANNPLPPGLFKIGREYIPDVTLSVSDYRTEVYPYCYPGRSD